jgi:AraC family transcriptional regulator
MGEELRVPITVVMRITPSPQTTNPTLQLERVEVEPSLPIYDPVLHHISLTLQAVIEGKSIAGQLSTQLLADGLVPPFPRGYGVTHQSPQEVTGGLSPYKLRRTVAYIKDHLEQELSLGALAAVEKMSPAYFARRFKQATGLSPHQYVLRCRMECAKQLLAETNLPLIEIALQVGCADQSHFTALFRTHFALTPKVYRDQAHREELKE